jgi:hypothetical protein
MTQDDCDFIFKTKSMDFKIDDILGSWDMKLVCDAALSPTIMRLNFFMEGNDLRVSHVFFGKLPAGSSAVNFNKDMIEALDFPSQIIDNNIRMARSDFMIGVMKGGHNPFIRGLKGSRGFTIEDDSGIRLLYTLRKVA